MQIPLNISRYPGLPDRCTRLEPKQSDGSQLLDDNSGTYVHPLTLPVCYAVPRKVCRCVSGAEPRRPMVALIRSSSYPPVMLTMGVDAALHKWDAGHCAPCPPACAPCTAAAALPESRTKAASCSQRPHTFYFSHSPGTLTSPIRHYRFNTSCPGP